MNTFNAPPKSFGLFNTHVYLYFSLQDTGDVLLKYNSHLLSKNLLKTWYIHLINNEQPALNSGNAHKIEKQIFLLVYPWQSILCGSN